MKAFKAQMDSSYKVSQLVRPFQLFHGLTKAECNKNKIKLLEYLSALSCLCSLSKQDVEWVLILKPIYQPYPNEGLAHETTNQFEVALLVPTQSEFLAMLCATAACYAHCLLSASLHLHKKLFQWAFGELAAQHAVTYPLPAVVKKTVTQLHLGGFYMFVKHLERSSQKNKTEHC